MVSYSFGSAKPRWVYLGMILIRPALKKIISISLWFSASPSHTSTIYFNSCRILNLHISPTADLVTILLVFANTSEISSYLTLRNRCKQAITSNGNYWTLSEMDFAILWIGMMYSIRIYTCVFLISAISASSIGQN